MAKYPAAATRARVGVTRREILRDVGLTAFGVAAGSSLVGCASSALTTAGMSPGPGGRFQRSWQAGTYDVNGELMGGTEIMALVAHGGKIYAGNSFWMESDSTSRQGCQILVLDSPTGQWRLDHQFPRNNLRNGGLKSVTFTTDGKGRPIPPEPILLASPEDTTGALTVYRRDDATDTWMPMPLVRGWGHANVRTLGFHRDTLTGVDRVFAGTPEGTFSGVYDADADGGIAWDGRPELSWFSDERVMGMTDCNGAFYCATTRHIYVRTDGPAPSWREIYSFPETTIGSGIRGLSAVPHPAGTGEALWFSVKGKQRRLDPFGNYRETVELDEVWFLSRAWNIAVVYVLSAYNDIPPYTLPQTGERVWLIGLLALSGATARRASPTPNFKDLVTGAYYFTRHAKGSDITHEVTEIVDPAVQPKPVLVATRTILVSPFPEDQGRVLYFGGFDCYYTYAHNTAWIYRGF
jgi:hypothetical protein